MRPQAWVGALFALLPWTSLRAAQELWQDPKVLGGAGAALLGVGVGLTVFLSRRRAKRLEGELRATRDRIKIFLQNGRADEAAKSLMRVKELVPELPLELQLLEIEVELENLEKDQARAILGQLELPSLDLKQQYKLGRVLEKGGLIDEATEIYQAILRKDADYADVKIRLDRHAPSGGGAAPVIGLGFDPGAISKSLEGRYLKMELIGKGGMGFVFRAHDTKRRRAVALKALSPFLTEEEEAVKRFMREARILAKFEHPNVVKIYDVEERPFCYYTMEFLEGRTLGHRLEEEGALSVKELLELAEALLQGLVHVHKHGVVHRDIKPENILLEGDGTPRWTDFGLATGDQATKITQAGQVMGTLRYMSPEQLRGEETTAASDLFSFGVVLFEAATGMQAFVGEDRFQRRLSGSLHEMSDKPLPPGLVELIEVLMESRSEDRIQSASVALEMVRALRRETIRKGPATFMEESFLLSRRVIAPLAELFQSLAVQEAGARREYLEETSNVRDLKLLVWRLNECIGRVQGAGRAPKGTNPRAWARETGQLRTDLARFVRHMDLSAIEAFALRLRKLDKSLQTYFEPFSLRAGETIFGKLDEEFAGRVVMRLPPQDVLCYGVPRTETVQEELREIFRDLIQAGDVQELSIRCRETPEGDRWSIQLVGDGLEVGHAASQERLEALGGEVPFPEEGQFKVFLPFVLEDRDSRAKR